MVEKFTGPLTAPCEIATELELIATDKSAACGCCPGLHHIQHKIAIGLML
jgi:hypothetical protein